MARHFDGGASTDKIGISSAVKWDDLRDQPFTITMWFKPEDNGGNEGYMLGKRNNFGESAPKISSQKSGGNHKVEFTIERASVSANARSISDFSYDAWQFLVVAHTLDEAVDNPTMFRGALGGVVTELATYDRQRAGSGTPKNVDAFELTFGSSPNGQRAFLGDIAEIRIYDVDIPRDLGGPTTAATIGALTSIMYGRPHTGTANSLIGYWPLNGGSPEPDLSGGGENSTSIVGTDIVGHPPIGPPFGFDYLFPRSVPPPGPLSWTQVADPAASAWTKRREIIPVTIAEYTSDRHIAISEMTEDFGVQISEMVAPTWNQIADPGSSSWTQIAKP